MHEYRIHTLVDITDNGNLKKAFPFKTQSGDVVHDKQSLAANTVRQDDEPDRYNKKKRYNTSYSKVI